MLSLPLIQHWCYSSLLFVHFLAAIQFHWHSTLPSQILMSLNQVGALPDCLLLLSFAMSFVFSSFALLTVTHWPLDFLYCCCCCTVSVTDFREHFSLLGIFHHTLLPHIWCMHHQNLLLSRFPWETLQRNVVNVICSDLMKLT